MEAVLEQARAVNEERERIARDLHDSVAHAIAVIGVQAGAARMHLGEDTQRSRDALETIESVARQTVTDMDQIIRGLRGTRAVAIEPPPGLATLETLVEQHRRAGRRITLELEGSRRTLRPSVDQAAYRILQEALTNAARHGTGDAAVTVRYGDGSLELRVSNGVGHGGNRSGGHGLVGMRERAKLLGGSLTAGASRGLFAVEAVLPYGS